MKRLIFNIRSRFGTFGSNPSFSGRFSEVRNAPIPLLRRVSLASWMCKPVSRTNSAQFFRLQTSPGP